MLDIATSFHLRHVVVLVCVAVVLMVLLLLCCLVVSGFAGTCYRILAGGFYCVFSRVFFCSIVGLLRPATEV